jgi:hypothetical protein
MFYCYATLIKYNLKKVRTKDQRCVQLNRESGKKMLNNCMITSRLMFKPQQNIAQSHLFPYRYSLGEKVGQLKIDATKLPVNEIQKNW